MSEVELGEALERLKFDDQGRLGPCFYYEPILNFFVCQSVHSPFSDLFESLKPAIEGSIADAAKGVFRCFALDANRAVSHTFTGFFVAPNILATAAHNLYSKNRVPFNTFIVCLVQNFPVPQVAFKKYSSMTVLFQPTLKAQTSPQKQRQAQGPDFAFFHVSHYTSDDILYPVIEEPQVGTNVVSLQFNGSIDENFMKKHIHIFQKCLKKDVAQVSAQSIEAMLYTHRLSASVGPIVAHNRHFLAYSATSAPCASGSPILAGSYKGFSAIQKGTLYITEDTEKQVYDPDVDNLGTLVTQPEFVDAYAKYVLPELMKLRKFPPLAKEFLDHFNVEIPVRSIDDPSLQ